MARRQSQVMEMLCAAIEMEEKEHTFFKAAADECPNELGKEVFLAILKGESEQKEGIQKIKAAIETSGKWPDTCTLYERKQMDVGRCFSAWPKNTAKLSRKAQASLTPLKSE